MLLFFSHWVVSNFVTPGTATHQASLSITSSWVCSNSCPLNQWCHLTISSSFVLFSSYFQSFPASGSFPMSQLLASVGQSIGASVSALVLQMNIQSWFPLESTGVPSNLRRRVNIVLFIPLSLFLKYFPSLSIHSPSLTQIFLTELLASKETNPESRTEEGLYKFC